MDGRRGLTRAALLDRTTRDEEQSPTAERQLAIVERPEIGQTYTHLLVLNTTQLNVQTVLKQDKGCPKIQ